MIERVMNSRPMTDLQDAISELEFDQSQCPHCQDFSRALSFFWRKYDACLISKDSTILNVGVHSDPRSGLLSEKNLVKRLRVLGFESYGLSPRSDDSRDYLPESYYLQGVAQDMVGIPSGTFDVVAAINLFVPAFFKLPEQNRVNTADFKDFCRKGLDECIRVTKAKGRILLSLDPQDFTMKALIDEKGLARDDVEHFQSIPVITLLQKV